MNGAECLRRPRTRTLGIPLPCKPPHEAGPAPEAGLGPASEPCTSPTVGAAVAGLEPPKPTTAAGARLCGLPARSSLARGRPRREPGRLREDRSGGTCAARTGPGSVCAVSVEQPRHSRYRPVGHSWRRLEPADAIRPFWTGSDGCAGPRCQRLREGRPPHSPWAAGSAAAAQPGRATRRRTVQRHRPAHPAGRCLPHRPGDGDRTTPCHRRGQHRLAAALLNVAKRGAAPRRRPLKLFVAVCCPGPMGETVSSPARQSRSWCSDIGRLRFGGFRPEDVARVFVREVADPLREIGLPLGQCPAGVALAVLAGPA